MLKKIFCLIGKYLPRKLNHFFCKFLEINFEEVWIGIKHYLDTNFPEEKVIRDNVCISSEVPIDYHFGPTQSIKNYSIKDYKKKIIIDEGVFVDPKSIIISDVIIRKNTFVRTGYVITKKTKPNTFLLKGSLNAS